MNVKSFFIGGIVGGIVNFLMGWLIYGIILKDAMPTPEGATENMTMIFLGCMAFGFLMSYLLNHNGSVVAMTKGAIAGVLFGLILGLYSNFFRFSIGEPDTTVILLDTIATVVMAAVCGAVVSIINSKTS